jgi:glycosyltransferase involved in cell wall biosynthesis
MAASGLFISQSNFLKGGGGGVQVCTREFAQVIEAAGIDLSVLAFEPDRRLVTRLLGQIDSSPFRTAGPDLLPKVEAALRQRDFDFVFLNQEALAGLGRDLRSRVSRKCRIVVLSHGLEHVDLLHIIRLRHTLPITSRIRPTPPVALGRILLAEQRHRQFIDGVCAISPFDADLERWLGTRRVVWLPRVVTPSPLAWAPVQGRLGFIGTLDHAPNLEGLVAILEVMARKKVSGLTVRIVGATDIANWLRSRYAHVEVVGRLDDDVLAGEAATWTAFLHPIFCLPRGASTKLALGLSWEIPIVTTASGRRGYVWGEGELVEADTPEAFVDACQALDPVACQRLRKDVQRAARSSPTVASVAEQMSSFLGSL